MVIAYIFFFIFGLGFGYAAGGIFKFLPVLFPVLLAVVALTRDDGDGEIIARLILALAVTVGGILLGAMLDYREGRRSASPA
jgi:hypothetical protein